MYVDCVGWYVDIYIGIIKFVYILLVFEVNVDKDCRMFNFCGEIF